MPAFGKCVGNQNGRSRGNLQAPWTQMFGLPGDGSVPAEIRIGFAAGAAGDDRWPVAVEFAREEQALHRR